MNQYSKIFLGALCFAIIVTASWSTPKTFNISSEVEAVVDTNSDSLPFPFPDHIADSYNTPGSSSPLAPGNPSNVKTEVEYDTKENQYNISEKMGDLFYRNPSYLTFEEFKNAEFKKSTGQYFRQRSSETDKLNQKSLIPKINVNSRVFDRIFGGTTVDIRPQGSAELEFAAATNFNGNPALPERQRKVTTFDFKEKIQMNVIANIGDKMKLSTNYNTEATFDFENKVKLEYTGYEDDIIKKIEGGNITFPSTQLINGSQSLFGLKTQLQFGRLMVTSVFSQQKGQSKSIEVKGGAQTTNFEIKADQYEANKHYFLAQYFKDNYDAALSDLNLINSSINITQVEVWVTNTQNSTTDNRNIVAFTDLGEYNYDTSQMLITQRFNTLPYDSSNNLLSSFGGVVDNGPSSSLRDPGTSYLSSYGNIYGFSDQKNYAVVSLARKLQASEYTLNSRLGYISLNAALNPNQVLAVAFEYTVNGRVYRVGELSTGSGINPPKALIVKLIRSKNINTKFYTWDLMMKNIYSLNGYSISQENFRLDVVYQNDKIGSLINYVPDGCSNVNGVPLIKLFNLDDLNYNNDPQPDGLFDFVPGVTIQPQNGRIIFPVREPFGSYLRSKFCGDSVTSSLYTYDALYDSTITAARQQPERNKFVLRGSYQSSSGSDIPLNAVNVPQGSVKVTAGGVPLTENVDYTVDYSLGRVRILNQSILQSNQTINISLESQSLFNLQTKTMVGARFEYTFNKDFQLGGTILKLSERPLTQKINIGDEPINNTIIGVDGTYRTQSRFITKLLDRLPVYTTKEPSSITLTGEVAHLFPGHARAIGKTGTSYIDDFEGAVTPLDIKNPGGWYLSSIPHDQPDLFPEGNIVDSLTAGYNRARIAWYYVDPLFQRYGNSLLPGYFTKTDLSNHYTRAVSENEIFPNKEFGSQNISTLSCTNIAFYPEDRGPYNYDLPNGSPYSAGMNINGGLNNPNTRWGGVMRKIETSDFEASNIEFLEFWMMDPFSVNTPNDGTGGDFYINLGTMSEDILPDNQKSFENGLPTPNNSNVTFTSNWGRYTDPSTPSIVNAFDNDATNRSAQDVGLDGFNDNDELSFYQTSFLNQISAAYGTGSQAYQSAQADPSNDNYGYFRSNTYDQFLVSILDRYKKYNGMEGNSPSPPEVDGYVATQTNIPDREDINNDNNTETTESYFQYRIELRPNKMVIGQNYITDIVDASPQLEDGTTGNIKWYQFKIPIRVPEKTVGFIENFNRVDFIRLFMKNFNTPIITRFGKMQFLRGDWRRYNFSLLNPGEFSPTPEVPGSTQFDITSVSLEENGKRSPVNYVLPPGIDRQVDPTQTQVTRLNEQSLALRFCQLADGDARAAYKTTQFDLRNYKRLKMYIHAESNLNATSLSNGEITCFVRVGSDFTSNYYEYEVPLTITQISSASAVTDASLIWPDANLIDLELATLVNAKNARNYAIGQNSNLNITIPYTVYDGTRKITIRGNPNLSNVRAIMIGVRNPASPDGTGADACGEIWVNELRMTDFDEKGGSAAKSLVNMKLADLGNMSLAGDYSSAGWGSIEKKVNERQREDRMSYNFSTQVELGKFLPPKSNISVPFYFAYGEALVKPQYNPLDPDVKLKESLDQAPSSEVRDSIKYNTTDYVQTKSLNFTNVKVNKKGGGKNVKSHIYDVSNINVTYAYNETYQRNTIVQYGIDKRHTGILGYNFVNTPKNITPFNKSKVFQAKYLKLIKDFNFYYAPSSLAFTAQLDRGYSETQLRNNTGLDYSLQPTFIKTFRMTRTYDLKYDLTKSLKFDFNALANATIDEPFGAIDTREEKDSILTNLKNLGRLTDYHHAANVTYTVPINKIPILDWVTLNTRYGTDYTWQAAPLALDSASGRLGPNRFQNTIQNSQSISVNANLNLQTLYNKIPYLKKINQPAQPRREEPRQKPKVALDSLGKAPKDTVKVKKPSVLEPVFKGLAGIVTSLKSVSGTYTETNGTQVPGFRPKAQYLGQDFNFGNGKPAPGWGFVFGSQDIEKLKQDIIDNQWLTSDTTLNTTFNFTTLQNLSLRANLEPFKNFKIEVTATRNYALNHQEFFRYNGTDNFQAFTPTESGNFTISYLTWNTSFIKDANDYSNKNFKNFAQYTYDFSKILSDGNVNSTGLLDSAQYYKGYSGTQQEVLTYAFLAAYSGNTPSTKLADRFPKIPKPNWRITYDGLSKIKALQKVFQSFSLSHGYRSSYNMNSFVQNLLYSEDANGNANAVDINQNFLPKYQIQQITLSEQYAPLVGVDMTFKNSLQARVEYKRDRTLSLAYSNIQVTEIRGKEYTLGLGYKFKKVKLPFFKGPNGKRLQNDLNVRGDFSVRENTTIIRKLIEKTNQPSAGNTSIGLKFSADYNINERFNIKAFYDRQANNPFVSSSYPIANTRFGLSVRFTLAQ